MSLYKSMLFKSTYHALLCFHLIGCSSKTDYLDSLEFISIYLSVHSQSFVPEMCMLRISVLSDITES